jgi:hypothetical protein
MVSVSGLEILTNQPYHRDATRWGGYISSLNELKEMASFSASGITYSPERASDWHYKHLIEHCQDYKLFLNLDERVTGADSEESTVCILAKDEDIAIKSFEHAWLFLLLTNICSCLFYLSKYHSSVARSTTGGGI